MFRGLILIVVTTSFITDPVFADPAFVHIVAGQSNAYGPEAAFTAAPGDQQILFWPEVGMATGMEDRTRDEFPPGEPESAPRWRQKIPRHPVAIGPVNGRWGADIALGRATRNYLLRSNIKGRAAIAKFAIGGSGLYRDWIPGPTEVSLLGRMTVFLQEVKASVRNNGYSLHWGCFVWMLGETDSLSAVAATAYYDNLSAVLTEVRRIAPGIPIIIAETSLDTKFLPVDRRPASVSRLQTVNQAQARLVREMPPAALIPTASLVHLDPYHYRADQQQILGQQIFNEWLALRGKARAEV